VEELKIVAVLLW